MRGNGITIEATVCAGIVAADIAALGASTGRSLPAVFFSAAHLLPGNNADKITIDTATMHDTVLRHVNILAAGIKRNTVPVS